MLVYSKKKLLPTIANVMSLSTSDEDFFYVYRSLYDESVILNAQYTQNSLVELIDKPDSINMKAYEFLKEKLPSPINSIACFILLVDDELPLDIEVLCGCLSVISNMSLVKYLQSDLIRVRRDISYNKGIMNEYQLLWQKFFTTAINSDEVEEMMKPAELHPKVENVPYIPIQVVPMGGMQSYGMYPPQLTPEQEEEEKRRKESGIKSVGEYNSDTGTVSVEIDDDVDYDALFAACAEQAEEELKEENKEKKKDSDAQAMTNKSDESSYEEKDFNKVVSKFGENEKVAGFDAEEDTRKALSLIGKHRKKGE